MLFFPTGQELYHCDSFFFRDRRIKIDEVVKNAGGHLTICKRYLGLLVRVQLAQTEKLDFKEKMSRNILTYILGEYQNQTLQFLSLSPIFLTVYKLCIALYNWLIESSYKKTFYDNLFCPSIFQFALFSCYQKQNITTLKGQQ